MRVLLAFILLAFAGCRMPREAYVRADTSQAYFDSLPSVSVPQSPYSGDEQARWFSIGYREGWQRGNSGVNAHPDPWYPQHHQCFDVPSFQEAHRKGFDGGFAAGFKASQERLSQIIERLGKKAAREPDGAANRSQPIRSETNSTASAAGSRR
jgi:hypothetical protein